MEPARQACPGHDSAWRGGAVEAIVNGFADARIGHRHYGDGVGAGSIQRAQMGEEIDGRLDEIAARREIEHPCCLLRAGRQIGPEGKQRLAGMHGLRVKPQARARRIM